MKMVEYDKNIYKSLCQLNYHYQNTDIAINIDILFDEYDVGRIQANGWDKKNNYYLVIHDIDTIGVKSLINATPILKGVVFDMEKFDTDQFMVLYNYAKAMNFHMIFIQKRKVREDILSLLDEDFEIRGSVYEL